MKVVWTLRARRNLLQVVRHIAEDDTAAAERVRDKIEELVTMLRETPLMGRVGRVEGTRELVVTKTPYILPYRVKGEEIQILSVYHAARRWPDTF